MSAPALGETRQAEVPSGGGNHACWRARKKNSDGLGEGVMFGENAPAKRSAAGATCDACVASENARIYKLMYPFDVPPLP